MNSNGDLYGQPIAWRETMRNPSFFLLDAHFVFVLPLFLFHIRWWTLLVLLVAVLAFVAMRVFQYRPSSAMRAARSALAGPLRPAQGGYHARIAVDYGFEYRFKTNSRRSRR